jgi:hypothetical protein
MMTAIGHDQDPRLHFTPQTETALTCAIFRRCFGSTITPPVGKSGPEYSRAGFITRIRRLDRCKQALISSSGWLWGGMVAMPTAIPLDPFAKGSGNAAGNTTFF